MSENAIQLYSCDVNWTVIGTKSGEVFPVDGQDFIILPGVLEKLTALHGEGHQIVFITNQAQVSYHALQDEILKRNEWRKRIPYLSVEETAKLLATMLSTFPFDIRLYVAIDDQRLHDLLGGMDHKEIYEQISRIANQMTHLCEPHHVTIYPGMEWRKPATGMIVQAQRDMEIPDTEIKRITHVGDRSEDKKMADKMGCQFMWAWDFFGWDGPLAPDARKEWKSSMPGFGPGMP